MKLFSDFCAKCSELKDCNGFTDFAKCLSVLVSKSEAQQQVIESLRNWNACSEEDHTKLIESDKRRIQLEEEVEHLHIRLADVKSYVEAIMRDRNEMDKVYLNADNLLSNVLGKVGEKRTMEVWNENRMLRRERETLKAERDAAVKDIEELMCGTRYYSCEYCDTQNRTCKAKLKKDRKCNPKWRGLEGRG